MIELQQNRYLWIHFASLAMVPLLFDACLAGLASAGSAFQYPEAYGFQFWVIALLGVVPPLVMQLLKPFYVFSLPPLALRPAALTLEQRRCLRLLTSWQVKALSVVSAGVSFELLLQVYERLPQITPVMTPMAGMVCSAISFFFMSLFLQLSISSARALLVGPSTLKRVPPYESDAIAQDFLILGFPLNNLLPANPAPSAEPSNIASEKSSPASDVGETNAADSVIERLTDKETGTVTPVVEVKPAETNSSESPSCEKTAIEKAVEKIAAEEREAEAFSDTEPEENSAQPQ
mgnify:CR=1 FL=1